MKNESIGFGAIVTTMVAQLGEAGTWINENTAIISGYLAIIGSIAWIISSYFRSRLDSINTKKAELIIKKIEMGEDK